MTETETGMNSDAEKLGLGISLIVEHHHIDIIFFRRNVLSTNNIPFVVPVYGENQHE